MEMNTSIPAVWQQLFGRLEERSPLHGLVSPTAAPFDLHPIHHPLGGDDRPLGHGDPGVDDHQHSQRRLRTGRWVVVSNPERVLSPARPLRGRPPS